MAYYYLCGGVHTVSDFPISGGGCTFLGTDGTGQTGIGGIGSPAGELGGEDEQGNGAGVAKGWAPFGMPIGLGISQFFDDLCEVLPDGLCDIVKNVALVIALIVGAILLFLIYKFFKK